MLTKRMWSRWVVAVLVSILAATEVVAAAVPARAAAPAAKAAKPAAKPAKKPADVRTKETLEFGRFGTVWLYRKIPHPRRVALFVSGDGGWNLGVVDMAEELTTLDALVVGIDIRHYLAQAGAGHDKCTYAAADFEALSQYVQKKLGYPRYITPVLVGYSSGATLVYAALVQAPSATFAGAVSLGFCPDLELHKPFCKGRGLEWDMGGKDHLTTLFRPAKDLEVPWVALQGTIDQVCDPPKTEAYVKQVKSGEIVMLPKVGHGYSVPRNWMPQFKEAFDRIAPKVAETPPPPPPGTGAAATASVADLPLVELPAKGAGDNLAVIISGDGGWASLDKEVGGELVAAGVPVVGWNSLQYFWTARTPDSTAADLGRAIRHYLTVWDKQRVTLIGYSFGADVLPFLVRRLPEDLRSRVDLVVLLGPGRTASFEFHVTEWLGTVAKDELPVAPEIEALSGPRVLCYYGEDESDSACLRVKKGAAEMRPSKGAHHFGGDYKGLAKSILEAMTVRAGTPSAQLGRSSSSRRQSLGGARASVSQDPTVPCCVPLRSAPRAPSR